MSITTTTAGRGRKPCKNCQVYVPVRCLKCPNCQKEFIIGESSKEEIKSEYPGDKTMVFAMGVGWPTQGSICPIPLDGTTDREVVDWIQQIQEFAGNKGWVYHRNALIQMAQNTYPRYQKGVTNPDFIKVRTIILKNTEK